MTNGIFEVGNTVIDALLMTRDKVAKSGGVFESKFDGIDFSKRTVLITGHRWESFGEPFNRCARR